MFYKYLTEAFLVVNFFLSLPLWHIIYKYIPKKPIISISLVDLIYRDTIIYVLSLGLLVSIGIIHTLAQDELGLSWDLALMHSMAINVSLNTICISLIFSSGLRLITLMQNSEAAGLLLCGPEHIAIIKMRFIIISSSLVWSCVTLALGAAPFMINFLHGLEDKSHYDEIKSNSAALLHLVIPLSALIINIAMKIYSDRLQKQMQATNSIYVIFGEVPVKEDDKFSFSLDSVILFPSLVAATFLTSFAGRQLCLLLFFPLQMFMITFVLPCYIIKNNAKIKLRALNLALAVAAKFKHLWSWLDVIKSQPSCSEICRQPEFKLELTISESGFISPFMKVRAL